MKKVIFLITVWVLPVFSANLSVLDEATQLGTIAGLASACGEKEKLDKKDTL